MSKESDLQVALKTCDASVQQYIKQLEAENAKLHKQIVALEVKNMSQKNRIAALENDAKDRPTFEERLEQRAIKRAHDGS